MDPPVVGAKDDQLGKAYGVGKEAKGIHQLISHGTFMDVIPDWGSEKKGGSGPPVTQSRKGAGTIPRGVPNSKGEW